MLSSSGRRSACARGQIAYPRCGAALWREGAMTERVWSRARSPAHGRDPRLVPVPGVGLDDGKGDTMAAVSLGPPSGSGGPQPAQRRRRLHR